MIQKVEHTLMPLKSGKKKPKRMEYQHVEYDDWGWADPTKFLPADCDLVTLRLESGKEVHGWIVGNRWEGIRKSKKDGVVAWRRETEPM